ncbi:TetR/AcrR family transcriptional regulator [Mycobacteroides salmoniphilum]|uniref:DNA-binding transcriptional repressor AcrR n=1 Tax=Mycobacteroides salmoniphilum TaxID=404941 RepID=A0A4R8SUK1_9MYCO|nr:TetR/AcrR family transcriptional regulator [Mycobacteroides salmoniphilum]TDZ89601.1 DNA-binding transcriptional repressor AcrR [Mycobacteroides salmoniphilum]TEA04183.1 DNA-binding transcriptional repressor AcrR [Mycobacteroides salmoniphilum]
MSRVDGAPVLADRIGSVVELDSLLRQLATGTLSDTNVATSRLLDAAREEFVAHGIGRTAVGDIARRAGVSRPTLYRKCGDKEDIVAAVLVRETTEFFVRAQAVLTPLPNAEDRMVEAFVMGMREARDHPLVLALKEFDAESFSRNVFDMNAAGYQGLLAVIAELLADDAYPAVAVKRALDLALRLTSTFLMHPSVLVPTDTDEDTREFAGRYLLPLMRAAR